MKKTTKNKDRLIEAMCALDTLAIDYTVTKETISLDEAYKRLDFRFPGKNPVSIWTIEWKNEDSS